MKCNILVENQLRIQQKLYRVTYDVTPGTITSLKDGSMCADDTRLGAGVRNDGFIDSVPMIQGAIESRIDRKSVV